MEFFRRLFGVPEEEEPEAPQQAGDEEADESTAELPSLEDVEDASEPRTEAVTSPLTPPPFDVEGATRRLPPEDVIAIENARLTFGKATDPGLARSNNEDAVLCFFSTSSSVDEAPDFGIFALADGMGGHEFGEKASAIAVRTVATAVTKSVYGPLLAEANLADIQPMSEVLTEAFRSANTEIFNKRPRNGGMSGTTLTAVVVMGSRAYIAHAGDSRAYLVTKNEIEQLTRDHSFVQRLIEMNQLTPEEAATHERRNELYRALGVNESLEADITTRSLPPKSKLIVCSDGLWNLVDETDMMQIVQSTPDPQDVCDKLVALANTRGGDDNISVILIKMG